MLQDSALNDRTEPADIPAAFRHMRVMAERYLHEPSTFRQKADLELAPADRTSERLARVEAGFRQILDGRGLSPDSPFRDLGVGSFYALLQALHFRVLRQTAQPVEPCFFLDTMEVRHESLGLGVTLYNLAPRATAAAARAAPPEAGRGGAGAAPRAATGKDDEVMR